MSDNPMRDAVMEYAKAGHPVFPCYAATVDERHKAKAPLTLHGLHDASTDETTVWNWWLRWPGAAIGLPTGLAFDVLDVDNKPNGPNGYASLRLLVDRGIVESTSILKYVRTPSGGAHLYFPSNQVMGNASFRKYGIDLRGVGGYVVAPPSVLYDGDGQPIGSYEVRGERASGGPLDHEAVRALFTPPPSAVLHVNNTSGGVGGLAQWLAGVAEGGRNEALFWAANRAIEGGFDPFDLKEAALSTGLSEFEVNRTIESALRKAAAL